MTIMKNVITKEVRKYTWFRDDRRHRWIEFRYKFLGIPFFTNRLPWS